MPKSRQQLFMSHGFGVTLTLYVTIVLAANPLPQLFCLTKGFRNVSNDKVLITNRRFAVLNDHLNIRYSTLTSCQ